LFEIAGNKAHDEGIVGNNLSAGKHTRVKPAKPAARVPGQALPGHAPAAAALAGVVPA